MPKIALLRCIPQDYDDFLGETPPAIIQSISDWEEISQEDYEVLKKASARSDYAVVEHIQTSAPEIIQSVASYIAFEKAEQERKEKQRELYRAKQLAREQKKALRVAKTKQALYEQLKKELGTGELNCN